jgi:hypothetical protein
VHFAGQFQANVSTVNNDSGHFDNAAFKPSYQQMQGNRMIPPNGWFNPQGDAAFRLLGCSVTSAWTPSGAVTSADPVLSAIVADADSAVPAKMVDLDPEQQLVSQIWGLQVRIATADGDTLMAGTFTPTAFIDIWDRATGSGAGDIGAGAAYQSVLTDLQWGDVSSSPFLTALQQASGATGLLSIKFNVDGLNMTFQSPNFMCGRVVGTIGPYSAGEPEHLVIGRQFMATASPNGNFFTPVGGVNFFPAVVDSAASCVYLDLGNALTTSAPGAGLNNLGDLTLGAYDPFLSPPNPAGSIIPLGVIPASGADGYATDADWYARTAGVVALPLSAPLLSVAQVRTLVLSGNPGIAITEWSNGAFVRADGFVYRLSPGDQVEIPVYAMQLGRPLADVSIGFSLDPNQLQPNPAGFPYVMASPPVATPDGVLQFSPTAPTDANGKAVLCVTAGDPGTPRWFNNGADYGIDGQVYGVRPAFADAALNDGPVNQWNFISFLVWSGYTAPNPITWTDLQPIFQQYANLYPVMLRFLNMADYDSIKAHAGLLSLAFGLPVADPNSMPVTRDLSPAKRQAILAWLTNPLPGAVAAPTARTLGAATDAVAPSPGDAAPPAAARGGKAAAVARRLILQAR